MKPNTTHRQERSASGRLRSAASKLDGIDYNNLYLDAAAGSLRAAARDADVHARDVAADVLRLLEAVPELEADDRRRKRDAMQILLGIRGDRR